MQVTAKPASRFGWPGARLKYTIEAEDGADIRVESVPGLEAHLEESHDGRRVLDLDVEGGTPFN